MLRRAFLAVIPFYPRTLPFSEPPWTLHVITFYCSV